MVGLRFIRSNSRKYLNHNRCTTHTTKMNYISIAKFHITYSLYYINILELRNDRVAKGIYTLIINKVDSGLLPKRCYLNRTFRCLNGVWSSSAEIIKCDLKPDVIECVSQSKYVCRMVRSKSKFINIIRKYNNYLEFIIIAVKK